MDTTIEDLEQKMESFREFHMLEKHRVQSFEHWPFPAESSCSIAKMAEAGFYWTGTKRENDTATCFVCGKTLDGWESEDEPWKEHSKHAPQCEFVKLGLPESELTVQQFIQILGTVLKKTIEKACKQFKPKIAKGSEIKLNEFLRCQK
ncbi:baculoviral IAP repeat-containing protein 5 [Scaptodrosophila lebanonensis]|uniref:Baculoviral IAP repeat-containing protein 5 n=1 Tax=Drosophila lebanonensis TaxID=7225 RepID=A0A6J2T5P3_DROLE|nr:baculoviral IAP repeat-containing protein 5 [Scaptodrosophila lebanonensis]